MGVVSTREGRGWGGGGGNRGEMGGGRGGGPLASGLLGVVSTRSRKELIELLYHHAWRMSTRLPQNIKA